MAVTNLEFCYDLFEYQLGLITVANGYRTDGFLVNRSHDPRDVRANWPEEYESKLAAITIGPPKKTKNHEKSLSTKIWWDVTFNLFVLRTMAKDEDQDGRTLDNLATDTMDDIEIAMPALSRPGGLVAPSAAVVADHPAGHYATAAPHIIGLDIDGVFSSENNLFPHLQMIFQASFQYAETRN